MKTTFLYTSICLLLIGAGLSSCGSSEGKKTADEKPAAATTASSSDTIALTSAQLKLVNVDLIEFQQQALKPIIYANGVVRLLPDSRAEVSTQIEGKIEQIFVREGQRVRKGQPIARLSSFQLLELQNDYAAAHSEVEFLQTEFARQDELRKSNIGVLAQFQSVDAKLKAARAREMSLKNKLTLIGVGTENIINRRQVSLTSGLMVRSPIDGFVVKFYENIGSLVEPQTLLAEVVNPNRVEANVYVYEKDADFVREGQPVELSFVNRNMPKVTGRVAYISRSLDDENRAITLHVNFQPPKGELLVADMNVQGRIIGAGERVSQNALPRTAILDDGEAKFVFVTNQPSADTIPFRKQKVEIVNQGDVFVEVRPVGKLPTGVRVANNNVLALEAERKKRE